MRGLRVKIYPTPEQTAAILDRQRKLRRLWNWLVARAGDTMRAREAWASRNGAGARPERPQNDAGEGVWSAYKAELGEWRARVRAALAAKKGDAALGYRNVRDYCAHFGVAHDYQLFPHLFDLADGEQVPEAHYQQALFQDYQSALAATVRGQRPPQRRNRDEDMPLRVGSGVHLRTFAAPLPRMVVAVHPKGPQMSGLITAQIQLPGVGWIAASLGAEQPLEPAEYWVEGVAVRREADGWYAAVRQHVVPPVAPKGSGTCGIDVGLVYAVAAVGDDGATLLASNPRKGSRRGHLRTPGGYVELIAERQAAGLPVSRLHCRSARNMREYVRRELFPFTDRYEFVAVEDLPSDIGFRNTPHLSCMRTIRTMLIDRYGRERVIDVDPAGTSRTCSVCGHLCDRSWSAMPDRVGHCPACGHAEQSDLNAARNVLRKLSESQAAAE
jgi:hypothetical protein